MSLQTVSIAIADEHTMTRQLLKKYLSDWHEIRVIYEASDLDRILEELRSKLIDIVIIDRFFQSTLNLTLLKIIRDDFPQTRIIMKSCDSDYGKINELIDIGIQAFISTMDRPYNIIDAIKTLAGGSIFRNHVFVDALYWKVQNLTVRDQGQGIFLSQRERKILELLWEEKTCTEIAIELSLSNRSIEKCISDMKEKINIKSIIGLVKYGLQRNIISAEQGPGVYSFPE